jgi:hypothetical protein
MCAGRGGPSTVTVADCDAAIQQVRSELRQIAVNARNGGRGIQAPLLHCLQQMPPTGPYLLEPRRDHPGRREHRHLVHISISLDAVNARCTTLRLGEHIRRDAVDVVRVAPTE